jgi:hypothetical protein
MPRIWSVAVEGDSDVPVAAAILRAAGDDIARTFVCDGKPTLDGRLRSYAAAALHSPWLVVRDLDRDAPCAGQLLEALRPGGAPGVVRIAVRAMEAWLLADARAVAKWLQIPQGRITSPPETIEDPKRELIRLARGSRSRDIRTDIVPHGTASIGPGYVDQIRTFCERSWRPEVAARHAPSLARCMRYVHGRA